MKFKSLLLYSSLSLATAMLTTSCQKEGCTDESATNYDADADQDDGSCQYETIDPETKLSGEITTDKTLTSDRIWTLSGRVVVTDGVTLSIDPGTILKAEGGREANASVLIIARGGKIDARGTAQEPIIFTSILDEISDASNIVSPNLDETFAGLWGGVIILGKAPISADASEVQIEGIPPSDPAGLYGGNQADDNSGIMRYVSIRHGGTLIGEGNEINGLTLGGVGNGTTIEFIEVVSNLDDGIEYFGGTVNTTNTVVWAQGDDAYDVDQAYSGNINNFMYIGGPDSDHAMEIDGPEGSMKAGFTATNGTMIGWNDNGLNGGEYADFRDGAQGNLSNIYFENFSEDSDVELDDDLTSTNYQNADLVFSNWNFNTSHLSAGNLNPMDICTDKSTQGGAFADYNFATNVTVPTGGADKNAFNGWTWASQAAANY